MMLSRKLKNTGIIALLLSLTFGTHKVSTSQKSGLEKKVSDEKILLSEGSELKTKKVEYTKISERFRYDTGFKTAFLEFYVETEFWNALPESLTKKEFYERLKDANFKSVTTTLFNGIPIIHPEPVNNKDLLREFMDSADTYIRNTEGDNHYELDPTLKFTESDKEILRKLLLNNLKSRVVNDRGDNYLFPPKTKISLVKNNGAAFFEIKVNECLKHEKEPDYKEIQIINMENEKESYILRKMISLSLLTEDPKTKGYVPIDNLYNIYLKR